MQSSWGHAEAIATYERIARWHILCLRELQEESGTNTDMHIDNAELADVGQVTRTDGTDGVAVPY